jgi:alanine racemase
MPQHISIFDDLPRDCWLNINTAQLTENLRRLQATVNRPALVVVKANGYGHGYELAANAFLKAGANYLGVATLSEGLALRGAGITTPILIMGGILPHDMAHATAATLDFIVARPDHIAALKEIPKTSQPVRAHLKVDTGMGRIGCLPKEAPELAKAIKSIPGVELTGLCTHFAVASIPNNEHTHSQINAFNATIAALAAINIRPTIIHAANSNGALYHKDAQYDMVRFGIIAYGVRSSMSEGTPIPMGVNAALSWHTRVITTKVMPKGATISYGCEYTLEKESRIGVLPIGYADGFRRLPKDINKVLINGEEYPTRGRITMDQCMVDLGNLPDITGAEAVLLGKQGNRDITARDLGARWGDNVHSIFASIPFRVPRHALDGPLDLSDPNAVLPNTQEMVHHEPE